MPEDDIKYALTEMGLTYVDLVLIHWLTKNFNFN